MPSRRTLIAWLAMLPIAACADPLPLPTVAAVEAQHDRNLDPPLYRALYDYSFLPDTQEKEQRVRLLVWLHYMKFNRLQLGLLAELTEKVGRERAAVLERQAAIVNKFKPELDATYDAIWEGLVSGAPEAELDALAPKLAEVHAREQELLTLRAQSVRTLFEAEAPFLQTLSPGQETLFTDATFVLRHRLDPYANPGDFRALVGEVYQAGQFGALSRATFDPNQDYLNIGGLWSEKPEELTGPQFPDARREIILYMVLLEPSLPEAITAELARRPDAGLVPGAPGVDPGPVPGQPPAPAPGADPQPVQAPPPPPVVAPDPAPAPAPVP